MNNDPCKAFKNKCFWDKEIEKHHKNCNAYGLMKIW
jgi:hypothetical protein